MAGRIEKTRRAISVLRNHRRVLVALSGGVDSAVRLAFAREALGSDGVLAVTGRSAAVTEMEIADARRVAGLLGVRHEAVDTREIDRPGYKANAGDRCFHCRSELFTVLLELAAAQGLGAVAYGAIVDDLGDHRPGMDAARRLGILAPLLDAGIGKNDVREFAEQLNLHVHDKPSNACLASRIPMGIEVTPERLRQVGAAESALRSLGFCVFRVRHHGEVARLELGEGESDRLQEPVLRAAVVAAVRAAGFRFVTLDLADYRSGSLNGGEPNGRLYSIAPNRDKGQ